MKTNKPLYLQLLAARTEEEKAHQKAVRTEEKIFNALKSKLTKTEGQETIEENGFSIVVNQPMTWKLNDEAYRHLCEKIPEELQFHRVKLEIDKVRYKIIMETKSAGLFEKEMQDCITVKPGKVSVKIEKMEVSK
jgi:hypothetical protein